MMGMFKFLRKVKKNEEGIYNKEKNLVMENRVFVAMMLAMCVLLVTPWGRWIIKWVAYIGSGFLVLATLVVIWNNHKAIKATYKHAKKLEKLGSSYEEEERARRWLCRVEGDDGFPAMSEQLSRKQVVYFADFGALNHFADALYGCYLAQTFQPKYMKLPDDAVVYTTKNELDKLCKLEVEAKDRSAPYFGYTGFIRANCKVVENCNQSNEENLIATILKIQEDENVSVVVVSTNAGVNQLAEKHKLRVINPVCEENTEETMAE